MLSHILPFLFFFNNTATPEIYPLSLHDALPISSSSSASGAGSPGATHRVGTTATPAASRSRRYDLSEFQRTTAGGFRSEEHTSELQSRPHLVCRLLLEKKNKQYRTGALDECS